ncbi:N-acetylmuramic acid 6-phosphate etherase [Rubellimicrobium arenae]|uniref:N-acetylmuramic acid 6-phosphate etherase n=1 Tax=Rubellimicrobium arenae TaxID=2817372 RepID=UPI001B318060|nr:N-acetylmuramic acid 6-phosphate etherase [Rubellimicrobium arenae]
MAERPTEGRHPASLGLHSIAGTEALARLLDGQAAALAAVRPAIPAIEAAAQAGAGALRSGGRMGYAGAGSSGTMALSDCLELAGTFGIPPDRTPMLFAGGAAALLHMTGAVEDDPALARTDLERAGLGPGDVLICVSASGGTPYTLAVAENARALGVTVVGIASVAGSRLLELSAIAILLDTGAELVAGSTRMGAGTAAKVALNMLSTRVGILLGHVHDGFMVNVVADNAKLVDRAARIVASVSGRGIEDARGALARTSGAVKPAILVAQGASPHQAAAFLAASGGHLGNARWPQES